MNINLNWELDSEDLMQGIRFHRETNQDQESCERIDALSEVLAGVVLQLGQLRYDTAREPRNISGQNIRTAIDRLIKELEVQIDEIKPE